MVHHAWTGFKIPEMRQKSAFPSACESTFTADLETDGTVACFTPGCESFRATDAYFRHTMTGPARPYAETTLECPGANF